MDGLFGAYGMFWDRHAVDWNPGTSRAWQMVGRRGERRPAARLCDFRQARGVYVLFDDHGATYVGIARGREGLGARLAKHHRDKETWSRFCWFAFDDVVDAELDGWSEVERGEELRGVSAEVVLRECEALLIEVLGTGRVLQESTGSGALKGQNAMAFLNGSIRWEQLREQDFLPGRPAHKADPAGFTDAWLRSLLLLDEV